MIGRLPRLLRRRGVIFSLLLALILGMGTFSGVVLFRHAGVAKASTPYDPLANGFGDPHSCPAIAENDGEPEVQLPGGTLPLQPNPNSPTPTPAFEYPNPSSPSDERWTGPGAPLYFSNGQPATFPWTGGAAHGASNVTACDDGPTPSNSFDGYDVPFQCVELIVRYAYIRWDDNPLPTGFGGAWGGNAAQEWPTHPNHFQQNNNGGTTPPAVGDILVWGYPGNPNQDAGHVAIVTAVTSNSVTTLEQRLFNGSGQLVPSDTLTLTNSGGNYTIQNDRNGSDVIYGWLHNTLSPDGHDVYAIGSDHHLYDYQSTTGVGNAWSAPTQVSSSVSFQGSPSSLDDGGVHYVFAISTGGDLYQFVKTTPTGAWTPTDVTNGRDTFQGSPDAYTFTDTSVNPAINHVDINLIDTSGQLVNLDYFFNGSIDWTYTQVTTGASLSGTPSGYAVPGSSSYYQLVYVRSGGQIAEYEYALGQSGYAWKYIQALSLSGANATGSPSAFTYTGTYNPGTGNQTYTEHSVFVIGDNGHLYVLHYVPPLNWKQQDISQYETGVTTPLLVEGSSPSADLSNGTTFFVYATGQNGHIYEFYASDNTQATGQPADTGKWTGADLGVDGSLSVTGSPWGYTYTPQGGGLSHIVFFSESDGNLYAKYYQYPAGWQFVALNHPSGVSMNGASPNGFYYGG